MKRANYLIEHIADMENLRIAFWKASRGKTAKPEVETFRRSLDKNLILLRNSILDGKISTGKYHYFTIYDPKERKICAASFDERVLHHAIINICHANFEKYQIFDSYACRLQKGTYAALDRAKYYQHKYNWFLKLDVRKYFDSIDHQVLKQMLQCRFKEKNLLNIFCDIIDSYETNTEKGVPIGNLTSQYFANHYLAHADHYIKEKLGAPDYVRYMDDMVIWSNDKTQLLETGKKFESFISEKLHLTLKPFCLNTAEKGLPFLGYLLYPCKTRLRQHSKIRFATKFKYYTNKLHNEEWTQTEYQQHILPLISFTKYANTFELRQQIIKN
ncbi:MAG: RNA-directed DNA polymerase [Prevotellaceae bacterium]|jgi:retron-type reverse transcriptase|nr:RNA-directed DNA polymerase [Prevotellaceae bacterium]